MADFEFSAHARDMLEERHLREEWIWRAIRAPVRRELRADRNMHYLQAIPERGGRVLHVVVDENVQPRRIVTAFFDRRLRKA